MVQPVGGSTEVVGEDVDDEEETKRFEAWAEKEYQDTLNALAVSLTTGFVG